MAIISANDLLNPTAYIDTDHPERGTFIARAGMSVEEIEAVWGEALERFSDTGGEAIALMRQERNRRLAESDWTQLPDAPVDREQWAAYRQQLRDMDFDAAVWPKAPGTSP